MFPGDSVQASGEGLVQQVYVGQTALAERLQLLSLSDNSTQFRITRIPKKQDSFVAGMNQSDGIFMFSPSQGQLNYSGDMASIDITFSAAPTQFTGLLTQELLISNSFDGSRQKLLVSMLVCIPVVVVLTRLVCYCTTVRASRRALVALAPPLYLYQSHRCMLVHAHHKVNPYDIVMCHLLFISS